ARVQSARAVPRRNSVECGGCRENGQASQRGSVQRTAGVRVGVLIHTVGYQQVLDGRSDIAVVEDSIAATNDCLVVKRIGKTKTRREITGLTRNFTSLRESRVAGLGLWNGGVLVTNSRRDSQLRSDAVVILRKECGFEQGEIHLTIAKCLGK